MAELRKIVIVLVIALLYTVFVFSLNEAINDRPEYDDYCRFDAKQPFLESNNSCPDIPQQDIDACQDIGGNIDYLYEDGCIVDFHCEMCHKEYDLAQSKFKFWQFLISAVFGLIAIIIGLYLPGKNPLNEWIGSGFLLGGFITLFIGTALYLSDFYKWLRPIVILFELLLVIFVAYRKLKR